MPACKQRHTSPPSRGGGGGGGHLQSESTRPQRHQGGGGNARACLHSNPSARVQLPPYAPLLDLAVSPTPQARRRAPPLPRAHARLLQLRNAPTLQAPCWAISRAGWRCECSWGVWGVWGAGTARGRGGGLGMERGVDASVVLTAGTPRVWWGYKGLGEGLQRCTPPPGSRAVGAARATPAQPARLRPRSLAPPPPALPCPHSQVFGYLWPGYQCYKALESDNRAQLQAWCKYWVIMAAFTAAAPLADTFLWWVPLYYEAKLAFAIYLWYNGERGGGGKGEGGVRSCACVRGVCVCARASRRAGGRACVGGARECARGVLVSS